MTGPMSPGCLTQRFYAAEAAYINAGGDAAAGFTGLTAMLASDVVLHPPPDLPWGGAFHDHAGYESWARQLSRAFGRLDVNGARFFTDGDAVLVTCRLITRSLPSAERLDLPMTQVVRVRGDCIVEFRPVNRSVPAYLQTIRNVH